MVGSKNGPLHRDEDGYYDEHRHWRTYTPMVPDELRVMPATVPNSYLTTHRVGCGCEPCQQYPNQKALRAAKVRYAARRRR